MVADVLGTIGVAILLGAFALNQWNYWRNDSLAYLWANAIGASLACASSYLIGFIPFVVLEGVWAAASAAALVRRIGNSH